MKKALFGMIAAFAILMIVGLSQAGITGSKHDFGLYGWSGKQTCLPCHTTHNTQVKDAAGNYLSGPLWNHQLSVATYTLYVDHTTLQPVTGEVDQNSKLCLSCHDGTVALDSFGGANGGTKLTGPTMVGTDLSNDHPIGAAAIWPTPNPAYMVDPALRDAKRIMPLRPMADKKLAVGCTSCHEPHNRKGGAPDNAEHMLWVSNKVGGTTVDGRAVNGSLLCMNCHKK